MAQQFRRWRNCDCRAGAPPSKLIDQMGHPPRLPVWLRWDQSVIYFVTNCVADRKPVLANNQAFHAFSLAASKLRECKVMAVIFMPNNLHVVFPPTKKRKS